MSFRLGASWSLIAVDLLCFVLAFLAEVAAFLRLSPETDTELLSIRVEESRWLRAMAAIQIAANTKTITQAIIIVGM